MKYDFLGAKFINDCSVKLLRKTEFKISLWHIVLRK